MTDWLFLLLKFIDMIIKNHLKVSPIGTAPLLHQGTFGDLTYPYRVGSKWFHSERNGTQASKDEIK